ncbi:Nitric oxide synthase, inducible [Bagarius yarrelli]|uniref:Nitric oxide synthase n=1 Tax=Bagarius yarrelli TaxID=175774 RepID=A0A556TRQ8_BAGYA|nr:Nitric oxide synthase, inducible [Bagarius yarrelli]
MSVHMRNFQDGSRHQDTLYHRAVKNHLCKPKMCEGSIMTPKTLTRSTPTAPISANELLTQAIDFINQYYKSFKVSKIDEHLARVTEVANEIEATGSYQLTYEELVYGAKQAWRNAPRCIGRIQWSNLQVFDARKCRTPKEMFQFLCSHIKYATNGGNLRSAITIFPQRTDGEHDFRVWNGQLFKYAGYQMEDGKIIGDPVNVELTEICVQLGWTPKYGSFDVLPLVLQANGEDPEIFEIPPELILEVEMEHPQYKWFKELNLKWYSLPAVSNMMLEVGGIEFTGCPFNGWYMGTEIGVRDFCDAQRYNILEKVGRLMGLDTHNLSSLWKDEALVAINVAVIHSFQKNKVTITDHHSAAESFMKHMETELRLRGGCPADWVWLVPPMSGSLTPVFHQEMINYVLSPFYYYQPDPWLTYVWKDETKGIKKRRKISFRVITKAVVFSQILMQSALKKRVPCTILYATETGKSQTLAKKLKSMLSCAFNPRLLCMDDYKIQDLKNERFLLVVASTFGNGDPPGNGETFKKQIMNLSKLQNKMRYCVFGLGSRMYPQFCAFAHAVDDKLAELGAKRVTSMGEGDELNGQEEAFSAWACNAFNAACEEFSVKGQLSGSERMTDNWDAHRYRVQPDSSTLNCISALSALHSKTVFPMKLKKRKNLQSAESSRSTLLVELEVENGKEALNYAAGDHVGIFPGNSNELVMGILNHLPKAPPSNQTVQLEYLPESGPGGEVWQTDSRLPACSVTQALTFLLDITTPPSQSFLRKLSQLTKKDDDRQRLLELASDFKSYSDWKEFRKPNFLEILEEFPSLEISATFLLSQLPLLKPRLYSLSSSPDLYPRELHLTLSLVNYRTQDGKGPLHHGVCSTWLSTLKEGQTVLCFVHGSGGFHLPPDPTTPTILIGAGSGIAPFRSFWQQRFHDMKKTGVQESPMILVFGCRNSELDHLYKDETSDMKEKGILKSITPAYSRRAGYPKVYVQDVLKKQLSEEIWEALIQKSGHVYVCGSMSMAREVALSIQEILINRLGINQKRAGEFLDQLKCTMAGSRLEKVGTVYSRVRDLMRAGVVKESKKPIWFDVYSAFPPKREPVYVKPIRQTRQKTEENVPEIFYKEDQIRA